MKTEDLASYYEFTRINFEPLLDRIHYLTINLAINDATQGYNSLRIDQLHDKNIVVLTEAAYQRVAHHKKYFYKCWWNQDIDLLKASSILYSNKVWKAAGKSRQGSIFDKRQSSRLLHRKN